MMMGGYENRGLRVDSGIQRLQVLPEDGVCRLSGKLLPLRNAQRICSKINK